MHKKERLKTKRIVCEALLWKYLDSKSICPRNHSTEYYNGWFRVDEHRFQRPDLTEEADRLIHEGCYGKITHHGMTDFPKIIDPEGIPIN